MPGSTIGPNTTGLPRTGNTPYHQPKIRDQPGRDRREAMATFTLDDDCRTALKRLFEADASHHLCFGLSARSLGVADHADLLTGSVRFRDFVMEGFLTYSVEAVDLNPGCLLRVVGEGSNRDWAIRPQVRFIVDAAGLVVRSEGDAEADLA